MFSSPGTESMSSSVTAFPKTVIVSEMAAASTMQYRYLQHTHNKTGIEERDGKGSTYTPAGDLVIPLHTLPCLFVVSPRMNLTSYSPAFWYSAWVNVTVPLDSPSWSILNAR